MSGTRSQTYMLLHPIEVNGKTVNQISLRRAKVKDMLAVERAGQVGDIEKATIIIKRLGNLQDSEVDELDVEDIVGISEIMESLFPKPPLPIGGN